MACEGRLRKRDRSKAVRKTFNFYLNEGMTAAEKTTLKEPVCFDLFCFILPLSAKSEMETLEAQLSSTHKL